MKKLAKIVLEALKPKAKQLGFSKSELESIAADIADNLEVDEETSEEEVSNAVDNAVNASIPFLKISQKAANRSIQKYKDDKEAEEGEKKLETQTDAKNTEEIPSWAAGFLDGLKSLQNDFEVLKTGRLTDSRRQKLQGLLKDKGTFGTSIMKNFNRMKFESDEEFDEFFADVESDLASLNQERADIGLGKLGSTGTTLTDQKKEEITPLTDAEVSDLANIM